MTIEKIEDFAENGDKSIQGLNLSTGFPRQQKPFRQWMNYLFNWLSSKTNEVIDEVNKISDDVQPLFQPIRVGELFLTTVDYTSATQVAERHGYGTWVRYAEGRTLVGYSSKESDPDEYRIMGNEFGENEVTLTKAQMPKHKHAPSAQYSRFAAVFGDWQDVDGPANTPESFKDSNDLGIRDSDNDIVARMPMAEWNKAKETEQGGDAAHNNIQPSIVVGYWLRTE